MELTYDLPSMRKIAGDRNVAREKLGDELADAFFSLVADMRNAMYLGELLESPTVIGDSPLLLQYPLTPGCVLEIQPLANGLVDQESWSTTHRVELVRIVKEGAKLI
ncbi:hypothetical protein NKH84_24080 [Mesorhizobium sp. M0902]|uniref:hypothetical protein n=1 Tax=Mesorhizobium sp. M0902 TaxID=2957021 RepID=UPI003335DAF0